MSETPNNKPTDNFIRLREITAATKRIREEIALAGGLKNLTPELQQDITKRQAGLADEAGEIEKIIGHLG